MIRVIVNPTSGGGRGRVLGEALRDALEERGASAELLLTAAAGDAFAFAARPGAACVVSVGGDGTANEVANGLDGDTPLAILPVGAANVVARELGLPREPGRLADIVVAGKTRLMDAGLLGDRKFLLGAGAGLDAAVVETLHGSRRGRKISKSSYILPTLRTIAAYAFPKIRVVADGTPLADDAEYVIVGNCRRSAGAFEATPEARIDDGLLDVCILRKLTLGRLAALLWAVWRPGFAQNKHVLYRQAKVIELAPTETPAAPLQIDGDPAGVIPATFRVAAGALRVVVPD